MKKNHFSIFLITALLLSSCSQKTSTRISINTKSDKASYSEFVISPNDEAVTKKGSTITISPKDEEITYTISGYYSGQIVTTTKNTILKLDNAYLENVTGKPAVFCEAKTEISTAKGSKNYIVSSGRSFTKEGAVYAKKSLVLGGSGTLYITGKSHGIEADDVKIKGSGTLYSQGRHNGSALNCATLTVEPEKTFSAYFLNSKNGIKADSSIKISSGKFYIYDNKTALKTDTKADSAKTKHEIKLSGGEFHLAGNGTAFVTDGLDTSCATVIEE